MKILALLALSFGVAACRAPSPPALDHARHGHDLVALPDGTWLVLGGYAAARGTRDCFAWRRGDVAWQRRADLPHDHAFAASVLVDGVLHLVGDGVWRYDAARDRWTAVVAPGALPRSHFGCAAVGQRIYTVGGIPGERGSVRAVDVAEGAVTDVPALPGFVAGDHFHVVVTLGGVLHVIGGLGERGFLDAHHALAGGAWVARPAPPRPLCAQFAGVAAHGDEVRVFDTTGGLRYDAEARTWTACSGLDAVLAESMLAMPGVHGDGRTVEVVGGLLVGDRQARVRLRYAIDDDTWTEVGGDDR